MSAQIIKKDGIPEYAILPYDEYISMLEKSEVAEDIAAYDAALKDDTDPVPFEIAEALLDGESPLKVWRKHHGLSQASLAEISGTHQATIAQIESGERQGSVDVLKKLAKVLGLDIGDLVQND